MAPRLATWTRALPTLLPWSKRWKHILIYYIMYSCLWPNSRSGNRKWDHKYAYGHIVAMRIVMSAAIELHALLYSELDIRVITGMCAKCDEAEAMVCAMAGSRDLMTKQFVEAEKFAQAKVEAALTRQAQRLEQQYQVSNPCRL